MSKGKQDGSHELDDMPRSDWLFERLRDDILNGDLAPDQKLSEPKLAERYGVSRAPIREAIQRLEERGLVTRSPRTGAKAAILSNEAAKDLVMIRENLEGLACKLAAQNMSSSDIKSLRAFVDQRARDLESGARSEYTQSNADFHARIARGSGSAELERLLCEDYLFRFRLLYQRRTWTTEIARIGTSEHERIVEAIEARDAELAEILMRRHVVQAMRRYLEPRKLQFR